MLTFIASWLVLSVAGGILFGHCIRAMGPRDDEQDGQC